MNSKNKIRARLIESTNYIVAENFRNCEGPFYVNNGLVLIDNEQGWCSAVKTFRSSLIKSWILEEDILQVQTLNSLYKFQIIKGTAENIAEEFQKIDLSMLQEIEQKRLKKTDIYHIQGVDGFIDNISLPYAMTWDEASEWILKKDFTVRIIGGVYENEN